MHDEQEHDTVDDDVEAHGARFNGAPGETSDVEAHRRKFFAGEESGSPAEEGGPEAAPSDADDDVEAHRRRFHT